MDRGYLKLWRKSLDSVVFNNPEMWKLWCWCLLKASYKKRWMSVITGRGETEVEILPGQFIYGRKAAAKSLRMNESTIRNRMEKLKKIGKIDIKPDTHYSIITICNWELYQPSEDEERTTKGQPKDNQRTTKGHKQEGKEGKEGKEEGKDVTKKKAIVRKNKYGSFENVLLSVEEYKKLKERFNGKLEDKIENLSLGIASKGYNYKSHYATILAWERKHAKDNPKKDSDEWI